MFVRIRSACHLLVPALALLLLSAASLAAQTPAGPRLDGIVLASGSGDPVAAAEIRVLGSDLTGSTGENGRFTLRIPAASSVELEISRIGFATRRQVVQIPTGAQELQVRILLEPRAVELTGVVVSATRDEQDRLDVPAAIGVIDGGTLREARPTHPSEIMGQIPGVWVNVTGGEGHMTSIRQPLGTEAVYLYLEDGIPTRSTGFFNHNALYEVNVPQADRIEVLRGPGSALHGSDAIGGVVSVGTRPPSLDRRGEISLEGGPWGFARVLGSISGTFGGNGVRVDGNLTRTDGWRSGTEYDRQAGTLRWDRVFGSGTRVKAVVAASRIDQSTAGSSALSEADFASNPTANYTPVSFRKVDALRASLAIEHETGGWAFSLTPFTRLNRMDMIPNWTLSFDPSRQETENRSLGLLARGQWSDRDGQRLFVFGVDLDRSPGSRFEQRISVTRTNGIFTAYTPGVPLYDYDVTFSEAAPYVHGEWQLTSQIRIQGGVRGDFLGYDYDSRLDPLQTGSHRRPEDGSVSFRAVSPKLGATWRAAEALNLFASWRHGFRAPSESQMFRQGSAVNTLELEPVRARSLEAGTRGRVGTRVSYEVVGYSMVKQDDILTYQYPNGLRETMNAGETRHSGLELGLGVRIVEGARIEGAWTFAEHTYADWKPSATQDLSGRVQESAPRSMGTTVLTLAPRAVPGLGIAAEWVHMGSYWTDPTNARKYGGHDLVNLRATWLVGNRVQLFARLNNVADERYAERAAWTQARGLELAPGAPRSLYAGIQIR